MSGTALLQVVDRHQAPFSWKPERVVANKAGTLAISTGPIHGPDGKLIGYYSSVWQKQTDGQWKIVFDGPGSAPPCPRPSADKQ